MGDGHALRASQTQNNAHGSILVYSFAGKDVSSWYASVKQESGWQIDKVDGIDRASVERHFPIK
jgi:hypothetical protein